MNGKTPKPPKRPIAGKASFPAPPSRGQSPRPYSRIGRHGQNRFETSKLNVPLLLITAAVSAISFFLASLVYDLLIDTTSRVLVMCIVWPILLLPLLLTVLIYSKTRGTFNECFYLSSTTDSENIKLAVVLSGALILLALCSVLFQWVYQLDGSETAKPTSYVFLIDDSQSMEDNDPGQERYKAIETVMKDMPDDFRFMVYGFSTDVSVIREMLPVSDGIPNLNGNFKGVTSIRKSLERIADDHSSGLWDGGDAPRVILLTDGYATDIDPLYLNLRSTLRKLISRGISVSTVGLGSVDTGLMKRIADSTGGVFISVAEANELSAALENAAIRNANRDLLSDRFVPKLDWLFGLLRIVFITILGSLIGFSCSLVYGREDSFMITVIFSGAKSLLGALIMELGTCALGFPSKIMWAVLWVLIGSMVCVKVENMINRRNRDLMTRV